MKLKIFAMLSLASAAVCVQAQIYDTNGVYTTTLAGSMFAGYRDGVGVQAMFSQPSGIVVDSKGNLYVWDANNSRIRRIDPDGVVTTFAGGGSNPNGSGTNVNLSLPYLVGMAIDKHDTQWAIFVGYKVIQVQPDARVSNSAFPASAAGMCIDGQGNIFFTGDSKVQIYNAFGTVSTISGYAAGYLDGNIDVAAFNGPTAIAVDPAGNLYVWDSSNSVIRRINNDGTVITFAGKVGSPGQVDGPAPNARFANINQLLWVGDRLVIVCSGCVRQADAAGNVTTIAGNFFQQGWQDNVGSLSLFQYASAVASQGNKMWVADAGNNRIRQITFNAKPQLVAANSLEISMFAGVRLSGAVGRAYRIESSTDTTTWMTEATILLPEPTYLWIDPDGAAGKKFYRAWQLP